MRFLSISTIEENKECRVMTVICDIECDSNMIRKQMNHSYRRGTLEAYGCGRLEVLFLSLILVSFLPKEPLVLKNCGQV
ncbi:hypothetical protein RchiOBHm_Chr4g0424941 [Rosa chinensis]|uniref:Uncharacterized protein n=1 Tax=Rosa chinensis TaxID=74649 RepID=A0A2P6QZ07_ROSCH|nr:hypothetical protein RchiOBHm_Chr4g0424941 [Rosa chinensis]